MQVVQTTTNVNSTAQFATAGTALANNPARVYFRIQNVGANDLYVRFSSSAATASSANIILSGAATAGDSDGGVYESGPVCYTGPVTVGGTIPTCQIIELAP